MKKELLKGGVQSLLRPTTAKETATPQEEELSAELVGALHEARQRGKGRPKKGSIIGDASNEYKRATFVVSKSQLAKLHTISYKTATPLKDLLFEFLNEGIKSYESEHGKVKPMNLPSYSRL